MKKRLKRYTSSPKIYPPILMSGVVFLKYENDEDIEKAGKGDVMLYLNMDNSPRARVWGNYHDTGYAGADVFDGKFWKPLSLQEFFPGKENHFSKTERPIDTYHLCRETLTAKAGSTLKRTYREHYELEEAEETP